MRRLEVIVHGRVQGVFFRGTTLRKGRELRLSGWVRNRRDGTVHVVAEGSDTALQQLLAFLHTGPPHARVTNVDESWLAATGQYKAFSVCL